MEETLKKFVPFAGSFINCRTSVNGSNPILGKLLAKKREFTKAKLLCFGILTTRNEKKISSQINQVYSTYLNRSIRHKVVTGHRVNIQPVEIKRRMRKYNEITL